MDLPQKDYSSYKTINACKTVRNLKKSTNSMIDFLNECKKYSKKKGKMN
jgi:hypothetical protein